MLERQLKPCCPAEDALCWFGFANRKHYRSNCIVRERASFSSYQMGNQRWSRCRCHWGSLMCSLTDSPSRSPAFDIPVHPYAVGNPWTPRGLSAASPRLSIEERHCSTRGVVFPTFLDDKAACEASRVWYNQITQPKCGLAPLLSVAR